MPPEEAGYTYAVEPAATNRLLANEEESIYGLEPPTRRVADLIEIHFREERPLAGAQILSSKIKIPCNPGALLVAPEYF